LDFGVLVFLGFLWFLFNLLKGTGKPGSAPRAPKPSLPLPLPPSPQRTGGPHSLPAPSGVDATQREGSRLEGLLRDLGRTLDEATRVTTEPVPGGTGRKGVGQPAASTVPEAVSLEGDVRRSGRVEVDQDDLAEGVVSRRIASAEARNAAHTSRDHREFDQKIRQEPADHTAVRTYTPQQLRDAIVWREILGPPTSLRPD
jgi:hypothetical protein